METMKNQSFRLCFTFYFMFLAAVLAHAPFELAKACSLALPDPQSLKESIIPRLAQELRVSPGVIRKEHLTRPQVVFLNGLGADCSGLDRAILTAAYSFSTIVNFQNCTYKGVVVIKGINAGTDAIFVNAPDLVCRNLIGRPFSKGL